MCQTTARLEQMIVVTDHSDTLISVVKTLTRYLSSLYLSDLKYKATKLENLLCSASEKKVDLERV